MDVSVQRWRTDGPSSRFCRPHGLSERDVLKQHAAWTDLGPVTNNQSIAMDNGNSRRNFGLPMNFRPVDMAYCPAHHRPTTGYSELTKEPHEANSDQHLEPYLENRRRNDSLRLHRRPIGWVTLPNLPRSSVISRDSEPEFLHALSDAHP